MRLIIFFKNVLIFNLQFIIPLIFNDIYLNLAEEFKISFYPFLLEGVALIPELNQSDGKHPNREGIQIISKNLANTIKNIIN